MIIKKFLSSWTNTHKGSFDFFEPKKLNSLVNFINKNKSDNLIARGNGTSYGDAATKNNGKVISMLKFKKIINFNESKQEIHCQGGVTILDVINFLIEKGYFLNVTPGTYRATIGGAIAVDAHGKNYKKGSFGNYVTYLKLINSKGKIIEVDESKNKDIFFDTIGGMGLTGIILEAKIKVVQINTDTVLVEKKRISSLDEYFKLIDETKKQYEFHYAWIDSLSSKSLGRGVFYRANYDKTYNKINLKKKIYIPKFTPSITINKLSIFLFNLLYFYTAKNIFTQKKINIIDFFFPLENVKNWQYIYGSSGFYEMQCVIPIKNSKKGIKDLLKKITSSQLGSFICVIKPISQGRGSLSFGINGITLAIDLKNNLKSKKLHKDLENIVNYYDGRIYLCKDNLLTKESFNLMYNKNIKLFKKKYLLNIFNSDLSKRLGIK